MSFPSILFLIYLNRTTVRRVLPQSDSLCIISHYYRLCQTFFIYFLKIFKKFFSFVFARYFVSKITRAYFWCLSIKPYLKIIVKHFFSDFKSFLTLFLLALISHFLHAFNSCVINDACLLNYIFKKKSTVFYPFLQIF